MTEVYDYIVNNIPLGLSSIFLIPLALLAIWRVLVNVFKNN